jgi:hypothetical protein
LLAEGINQCCYAKNNTTINITNAAAYYKEIYMKKIFLDGGVYEAVYDLPFPNLKADTTKKRTAYAQIYYGTKEAPTDHKGDSLFSYRDDWEGLMHNDLRINVLPIINAGLKNTPYVALGVSDANMNPFPFFTLVRNDREFLTSTDIKAIESHLLTIIDLHNSNNVENVMCSSNEFFNKRKTIPDEITKTPTPTHNYNLRSRQ